MTAYCLGFVLGDMLSWPYLQGHDAPVLSVAFDPKNEFLASADADGTVCIWNLSSTKARRSRCLGDRCRGEASTCSSPVPCRNLHHHGPCGVFPARHRAVPPRTWICSCSSARPFRDRESPQTRRKFPAESKGYSMHSNLLLTLCHPCRLYTC